MFLYGVLFVGVALLLWRRQDHPTPAEASEPPVVEEKVQADPPVRVAAPDTEIFVLKDSQTDVEEPPRAVKRDRVAKPQSASITVPPPEVSLPPEQRVYSVVSRAFVVIENWFDRFASPVAVDSDRRISAGRRGSKVPSGGLSFPVIQFAAGSAELTRDSQRALCDLAEKLAADSSATVVEIRGQGAEDGPEAYRYILSQARAQSVRDFLVEAGVDTRKLATRALGSDQRDSTRADSQIEFVVRR
jgi:outer membrane protein OmpA-like peptidoglycan-associated protein